MINILFIVGILINLLKAGDLILREHHKRKVQDAFETLTLWLDYLKPVQWFGAIVRPKAALFWALLSGLFIWFSFVAALGNPNVGAIMMGGALALLADFLIMTLINLQLPRGADSLLILLALPLSAFVMLKYGKKIIQSVVGDGKLGPFFGRSVFLYIISAMVLAGSWGLSTLFKGSIILSVVGAIMWPLLFAIILPNAAWLTLVPLIPILWLLELLLRLVRAICWRIVEYTKGAFAALILFITVCLGIYKLVTDA